MTPPPYRVAVWGTGDVGHYVLRGVISRPDLELVGVRVWSRDKVGKDAGQLVGWEPVGVRATASTEDILALDPDCLIHTAPSRVLEPVAEYLAAGVDVLTLGSTALVHPATCPPDVRGPLERACAAGGSSLFYGGIDPGFAAHTLPLVLSGVCERIDLMTVYEVRDYDPLPLHQLEWFNFGRETTDGARFFTPGGIAAVWGPSLRLVADAVGVDLDGIEEFHEVALAPERFEVPALTVAADTIAAVRFGLRGIVSGVERLRLEHVNRLRHDLAPHWQREQGYGVLVEGQPRYRLHLELADPAGRQDRPALFGTAMYLVNAVPGVCAAPPGIVTVLDLPYITCHNVGGRHQDDNWTLSGHIVRGERRSA